MRALTHLLLLTTLFTGSGCATQAVWKLGRTTKRLQPTAVQTLTDGSVLVLAKLTPPDPGRIAKRFVVIPHLSIERVIQEADSGILTAFVVTHGEYGSRVYPPHAGDRDAELRDFPSGLLTEEEVSNLDSSWTYGRHFEYRHGDRARSLTLASFTGPAATMDDVSLWHYPAQLLLIPAACLDVVVYGVLIPMTVLSR